MTFFFYDLETSGLDARWQRIMQFAGQRTDEQFNKLGKPINLFVKLTEDVLPHPEAVIVTGITPQRTLQDGVTEVELLRVLNQDVFTNDTVVLGFNSIRFDDEFLRYTLYRNFFDPYEREWTDGRSRWDILDVFRMTRALRPQGIEWPLDADGKPTNRLEALAVANKVSHQKAHDALSDVQATIDLAELVKKAQPKLFDHLFDMRQKSNVQRLLALDDPKPIVHSSGRFSSEYLNTSVVIPLCPHPNNANATLVYDLRFSPTAFRELNSEQIAELAFTPAKELAAKKQQRLPVKAIHSNKSPAVAPLGVLDDDSQGRIKLTLKQVETHLSELAGLKGFAQRVYDAFDKPREAQPDVDAEGRLYDSFISDSDKATLHKLRSMSAEQLAAWQPHFNDDRLQAMLLPYRARNFPESLSHDEQVQWQQYRAQRLQDPGRGLTIENYANRLKELAQTYKNDKHKMFLIEELRLYAESIVPFENSTIF